MLKCWTISQEHSNKKFFYIYVQVVRKIHSSFVYDNLFTHHSYKGRQNFAYKDNNDTAIFRINIIFIIDIKYSGWYTAKTDIYKYIYGFLIKLWQVLAKMYSELY